MTFPAQEMRTQNATQILTSTVIWPWTSLDVAFLQFLKSHQASSEPLHDVLALLTSYQMGRGHACLDLDALWHDAKQLLDWTDAQVNALNQQAKHSNHPPSDLFAAAVNPWAQAAKTLPWALGEHSPMVVSLQAEGQVQRVYLRRAWQAEQFIQAAIQFIEEVSRWRVQVLPRLLCGLRRLGGRVG